MVSGRFKMMTEKIYTLRTLLEKETFFNEFSETQLFTDKFHFIDKQDYVCDCCDKEYSELYYHVEDCTAKIEINKLTIIGRDDFEIELARTAFEKYTSQGLLETTPLDIKSLEHIANSEIIPEKEE